MQLQIIICLLYAFSYVMRTLEHENYMLLPAGGAAGGGFLSHMPGQNTYLSNVAYYKRVGCSPSRGLL